MLHYQTVNLFSSAKCFIYFICDIPLYIRSNRCNTVCTILVKVDVLDTYGAMIWSYFGIAFLLFFMMIENTAYTSCSIFHIMNFQNNQFLNLNDHHLESAMIKGFHGFPLILPMPRKLYKRCWPENVHIVAGLEISAN